jgi:hypothetical protein
MTVHASLPGPFAAQQAAALPPAAARGRRRRPHVHRARPRDRRDRAHRVRADVRDGPAARQRVRRRRARRDGARPRDRHDGRPERRSRGAQRPAQGPARPQPADDRHVRRLRAERVRRPRRAAQGRAGVRRRRSLPAVLEQAHGQGDARSARRHGDERVLPRPEGVPRRHVHRAVPVRGRAADELHGAGPARREVRRDRRRRPLAGRARRGTWPR